MKQILIIVMALVFTAALPVLTACSPENDPVASGPEPAPDPDEPGPAPDTGHYLVVYFSRSGNTRSVATEIRDQTGGTLLEITASTPYPPDYDDILAVARQEISTIDNEGIYPSIETSVTGFDSYDMVFICTPLWYGHMSTPMQSFLHSHAAKLEGKKLALVVTSSSSGISSVIADAHRLCPTSAYTGEALWITASQSGTTRDTVTHWLEALGINREPDNPGNENDNGETINRNINVIAGGIRFSATLEDNETSRAFSALLPMTVNMNEMNGNEKYHYLPQNLPVNAYRPGTISTGDLLLYGSDCMVLFYESFQSSYSYTRLGHIDNPAGLASALGPGSTTVTFEPR